MIKVLSKDKSPYLLTKNKHIRDVSFVLASLLRSGYLGASEILRETGNMIPEFRNEFGIAAKEISVKGLSFSEALKGIYPPELIPAIRSGEESGGLDKVLQQLWEAAKIQEEVNKSLKKLITPAALIVFGILINFAFMAFLVPTVYLNMAQGVPKDFVPNPGVRFGLFLNDLVLQNWPYILAALVVIGGLLASRFSQYHHRKSFINWGIAQMIRIRYLGVAYANLKFGLFAKYLEIVSLAGLDIERRISLVEPLIPKAIGKGLALFKKEMINEGLNRASSFEGRDENDPRHSSIQWPPYIRIAFAQSGEEGNMSASMNAYGKVMVEDGTERLNLAIHRLNIVCLLIIGLLVAIPMGFLYATMLQVVAFRLQAM